MKSPKKFGKDRSPTLKYPLAVLLAFKDEEHTILELLKTKGDTKRKETCIIPDKASSNFGIIKNALAFAFLS